MMTNMRERSAQAKRLSSAVACFAILAALQGSAQVARSEQEQPKLVESGTIELDDTHAVRFVSSSGGSGTLTFQGRKYPFDIRGADAVGLFKVADLGTVYNVTNVSQFAGTYAQAKWSYSLDDGKLWLEKTGTQDVVIRLDAKQPGAVLSMHGRLITIIVK